jgi:chromosome segregation ATPase
MINFALSILSLQETSPITKEGAPYWILWFFLCIILLLITFIFLRDKSMRQRVNLFLSKAKRKFIKTRLQARVRKEKHKKDELIMELGIKTWNEGIRDEKSEKIDKKLEILEESKSSSQKELEEINSKIKKLDNQLTENGEKQNERIEKQEGDKKPFQEKLDETKEKERLIEFHLIQKQKEIEDEEKSLNAAEGKLKNIELNSDLSEANKKSQINEVKEKIKKLETNREKIQQELEELRKDKPELEKEIKNLQRKINDYERTIKNIEKEKKEKRGVILKETKELRKDISTVQKKIKETEKQKEPLFEDLGKVIDEFRVENKELTPLYSQIDKINKRIQDIEEQIQNI